MRFGVFYELQLPKPWGEGQEHRLFKDALEQIALADRLGVDYAWCVEHHFLEEYSHCSAPEVFLAAAASRTERIRLGHGIRQVIPNYNHPARVAEGLAALDLISDGRLDFGIGEGATRHELHGFGIEAKTKRAQALEAAEQIANMMVMEPYPGFDGETFSMPCRNVLPKPLQKPHPPMWMACTNRDTIKVAASIGVGVLAFAFVDPDEARQWSDIYYSIIKSDQCRPIGHSVNANIAIVSAFSLHRDRDEAIRRGQKNFDFFGYALASLVTRDSVPGRSRIWEHFERDYPAIQASGPEANFRRSPGIGTPDEFREHIRDLQDCGMDQVIFMQQAGRQPHEEICQSLELFAADVRDDFAAEAEAREARKAEDLAPWIEAALARKQCMPGLTDEEIPVIEASVASVRVNKGA